MIVDEKPSLSVCAFGAGAAHAALLALVLPVLITLPAPSNEAQGIVAIQVAVRSAPPPLLEPAKADAASLPLPALIGEGDVDEEALPAPPLGEITGSLPEVSEEPEALQDYAALPETIIPASPAETVAPAALPLVDAVQAPDPEGEVGGEAIASIDSMEITVPETAPVLVPVPLRKPDRVPVPESVQEERAKPTPIARNRVASPRRARTARPAKAKSAHKGFLGGTQATTMPEYPFAVH